MPNGYLFQRFALVVDGHYAGVTNRFGSVDKGVFMFSRPFRSVAAVALCLFALTSCASSPAPQTTKGDSSESVPSESPRGENTESTPSKSNVPAKESGDCPLEDISDIVKGPDDFLEMVETNRCEVPAWVDSEIIAAARERGLTFSGPAGVEVLHKGGSTDLTRVVYHFRGCSGVTAGMISWNFDAEKFGHVFQTEDLFDTASDAFDAESERGGDGCTVMPFD